MSSWAERVHRRAADFGSVVTSCGHPGSSTPAYPYRLEKVKFGIPLEEVCKNDNIPGPLLVLILKLNKESPNRRDVFRAPGHQGAMKKLIHFLQAGRLVNVDNYSVYTIASVLKKFLRKIPNGVFGRTGENELFAIIELESETEQTERLHKLFTSLPKYTQHLLVLLFGTFRVIASNAAHAGTGMTSEALGVSVAPSFFQSCVSDGKTARMEDVLKFKVATKIMKHIIDKFATHDLFGRDNYEYYARVTGRILKVQDEWICSFQYPPPPRGKVAQQKYALQHSLEAEKTWLQCQCERWGLHNSAVSLGVTPEHSFMESCARLSVSLEGPGLFAMTSSPLPVRKTLNHSRDGIDGDDDEDDNDDVDNYDEDQNSGLGNDNDNTIHYCGNDADLTAELDLDIEDDDDDKDDEEDDQQQHEKFNNGIKNGNFYISGNYERIRKLGRLTMKTERGENKTVRGESLATNDNLDDVDGDRDGAMRSAGKRRFRQYKKNTPNSSSAQMRVQMQQQRRLRSTNSGSKSLDDENCQYIDDYEFLNKSNSRINNAATTSNTVMKTTIPDSVASTMKGRFCSRCKHGIRHSSSCSSSNVSTGGTNTNGSGMTMEELRAVNRYAESTKSLSYLPQVHERQAARMRTRSEWFLGPKDDDILCVDDIIQIPANTCSNCYLQQHQQQQHQQQQNQHEHEYPVDYLGGGSTRDMRHSERSAVSNVSSPMQDQTAGVLNNTTFLYYKQPTSQQPHQHQQHQLQRQSFHLAPEHMDTDEECFQGASASLHSMQQPKAARKIPTTNTVSSSGCADVAVRDGGCPAMLLDNNYVGNIRLSNSAESVQYIHKRPSTRRILLGANIPRQYPLRSSLKRHKEKQVGLATTAAIIATTTAVTAATANTTTSNIRSLAVVPAGILNNPLSNAGHNNGNNESCTIESSITFKAPRL
ncbi:rho GTPase activating protein at 71E isoform 2-T3 [Glossina fuscipes fuscipes]